MLKVFKWVLCAIHTNTCIFVDLDFYRIFIWDVFMPYFLWVLFLFCCFDAQGAFVWQIFDKDIRHMFKSKCYLFDLVAEFLSLYSWPSNILFCEPRQKANHSRIHWVFCKNVYHLYIYTHIPCRRRINIWYTFLQCSPIWITLWMSFGATTIFHFLGFNWVSSKWHYFH